MSLVTDLIAGVLIIVLLGAIIRFMVRPQKPSPDTASISTLGTFLNGLLAAAALGVSVQGVANGWGAGLTSGAVVGLLFGLLSGAGPWKDVGISLISGFIGAFALVVTIGSYFSPQGVCTPAEVGQRVLGFVLVALAFVAGGAVSWFRGFYSLRKLGSTLLAAFGALEVAEFLSSPLGVALVQLGVTGWVVSLVAALALGFGASIWPELVIGVAGATVALGGVIGTAAGSANCLPGADISALAPFIGFGAVYGLVRAAAGRHR